MMISTYPKPTNCSDINSLFTCAGIFKWNLTWRNIYLVMPGWELIQYEIVHEHYHIYRYHWTILNHFKAENWTSANMQNVKSNGAHTMKLCIVLILVFLIHAWCFIICFQFKIKKWTFYTVPYLQLII